MTEVEKKKSAKKIKGFTKYYAYRRKSVDTPVGGPKFTNIDVRGKVIWLSDTDLKFFNLDNYEHIPHLDVPE